MSELKKFREKANISRAELAEKIGLTVGAVGHYENGRRMPDLDLSRLIIKVLQESGIKCGLDDVFPPKKDKAA